MAGFVNSCLVLYACCFSPPTCSNLNIGIQTLVDEFHPKKQETLQSLQVDSKGIPIRMDMPYIPVNIAVTVLFEDRCFCLPNHDQLTQQWSWYLIGTTSISLIMPVEKYAVNQERKEKN